jgi:uncharacterized protein DUF6580
MLNKKYIVLIALVVVVAFTRLIPHPINFTPIGALGLFAGAFIIDRRAWVLPIIALLLSDFFVGFYEPVAMLFVYLGFALSAFIGRFALSEKRSVLRLGGAAITSATLFFIVSNFGTWMSGSLYPMSLAGLIECYVMAIPFYGNTLLGDLFYVVVLFGIYEGFQVWLQKRHIPQVV